MSANWCVYYNGMAGPSKGVCKAGVTYRNMYKDDSHRGVMTYLPCFKQNPRPEPGAVNYCHACRFPTKEEVEAEEAQFKAVVDRMTVTLTAINPWRKAHKDTNFSEKIDCPVCKGVKTLHLSISKYNNHIHGHCSTSNCISWME